MALPVSGTITAAQIYNEYNKVSHTSQAVNMDYYGSLYGVGGTETETAFDEFYGYNWTVMEIEQFQKPGSPTWITSPGNISGSIGALTGTWDWIIDYSWTGYNSGSVTMRFDAYASVGWTTGGAFPGVGTITASYSINGGGSYFQIGTGSVSKGSGGGSGTVSFSNSLSSINLTTVGNLRTRLRFDTTVGEFIGGVSWVSAEPTAQVGALNLIRGKTNRFYTGGLNLYQYSNGNYNASVNWDTYVT